MRPERTVIPEREVVSVPDRPSLSNKARLEILIAHGGRCGICGEKISGPYEIDHRIPRGISARDDRANLYPAHPACHAAKTTGKDAPAIAKVRRLVARADGNRRDRKPIPSRGFGVMTRKMDGSVAPTKAALRSQRSDQP